MTSVVARCEREAAARMPIQLRDIQTLYLSNIPTETWIDEDVADWYQRAESYARDRAGEFFAWAKTCEPYDPNGAFREAALAWKDVANHFDYAAPEGTQENDDWWLLLSYKAVCLRDWLPLFVPDDEESSET